MLLSIGPTSLSQEVGVEPDRLHAGLSVGINPSKDHFASIGTIDFNFSSGQELYGVCFFFVMEMKSFGGYHGPDDTEEFMAGIAVTYGRSYAFKLSRPLFPLFPIPLLVNKETEYRVSASIGASLNRSVLRDGPIRYFVFDGVNSSTRDGIARVGIGIPVQLELVQMLSPSIGYVHRIYANINAARSFWSVSWAVQVGW
ncbi:MAG: hypothetical protein MUE68_07720 [Bacteroidetes bacterium]|nr:hypothetical protein [Bacteroidota bacterium]